MWRMQVRKLESLLRRAMTEGWASVVVRLVALRLMLRCERGLVIRSSMVALVFGLGPEYCELLSDERLYVVSNCWSWR